ncbi:MAG: trypsin-like peptidase domain-containing protein [Nitrosarchaeum sp.]|nr:trypsin-like peptidase domain-containing protein [Nitrosarchaeum sp.]MBP0119675.1 trypsin-like peptidase domain-containing protein [Nitrosarchaeum sp.]MBP0133389.1 trypsin-like peptidase domain-containing protein [Nitrosarchaeum sp.]PHY09326.1 MAG: trypsin [Nitrosarchaeum sp.]
MDKSAMLTGGIIGAVIVAVIFGVMLILPSSIIKSENIEDQAIVPIKLEVIENEEHIPSTVIETIPKYTKNISLTEIFEKAEPSVVRINVQKIDKGNGTGAVGSGFVFDKKGHIITNAHVIKDAKKVNVTFLDGRSYGAEIIGFDVFTDIGIIKVNSDLEILQPLSLGDSSNLKVGESIAAIGNPFGLSGSMSSGIISQLDRLLPSGSGYSIPDVIQTDAAINPGNSGGPLLNMRGEVVGINTAIETTTGTNTGVGFAVSSQTLAKIIPNLIKTGKYEHPWMGISGRDIEHDLAGVLNLKDAVGFLVITVVDKSPADKAGIHGSDKTVEVDGEKYQIGGDIILSVDGKQVRKIDDILIHLQRVKSIGDEMNLEILRDGRTTNITIILEERPISK